MRLDEPTECPVCGLTCPPDRVIGYEYRGIFDGVAQWQFPCEHIVDRFPPTHWVTGRLREAGIGVTDG